VRKDFDAEIPQIVGGVCVCDVSLFDVHEAS
jgi:hypothetical protein